MRIGLVELLLILLIATLSIGPSAALWVERWMRRAQRSTAAAARRRAAQEAQRAAEREEVLQRFQKLSIVFVFCAAAALVWGLVLRPIDVTVTPYTAPEIQPMPDAGPTAESGDVLSVTGWRDISCIRERDGWLYFAAQADTRAGGAALLRMREDGSGLSSILTAEGEITGFDFDPDGDIWYTVVTASGGVLCRAGYDGWGAASEQIVTQIDGTALSCPTAVAVGADGSVYFTDAAAVSPKHGVESALRTELVAHTGTGSVYVYDPAARTVQTVLTGAAGASGLALDENGTLYVSDLGTRCIWSVEASARGLTAGGRNCGTALTGLPGYPGALALDEDGTLYISYRWARADWLENHADSTLLRGAALRLSQTMQQNLFSLPAGSIRAEAAAPGGGRLTISGKKAGSTTALCPVGSRLYLAISGETELNWVRI